MENKRNYQKELDQLIDKFTKNGEAPTLLLHSCCAPCSSYVLEYLSNYFKITIYYYNPNIYPATEYSKRVVEQKTLSEGLTSGKYPIHFIEGKYETDRFYDATKGLEHEKEGQERCFTCYELRLREVANMAKEKGFDYFTTTLSISPYKNADKLNQIGEMLSKEYDVKYLYSDFKKKNGYKRSIELSTEYGLYRQDYCGCIYSKMERDEFNKQRKQNIEA